MSGFGLRADTLCIGREAKAKGARQYLAVCRLELGFPGRGFGIASTIWVHGP